MRLTLGLVISSTLLVAALAPAGDAAKGKTLYLTCAACHGEVGEGKLELNAPRIAGQEEWYLKRQLENFRDGVRGSDPKDIYGMQMKPMAMILAAPGAMDDVVAYIRSFPTVAATGTVDNGGDPAAGKALYLVCAACHGEKGEGKLELNSPRIAGQESWYMERQLANFKAGMRGTDTKDIYGMQMKPMSMTLTSDKAIKDVVAYIRTLKP